MKFAVASYGTRGDIEPCLAIGRELMRRGHSVRMAIPPNLVNLAEAAGLPVCLRDAGVKEEALPRLADEAAAQWTGRFNPRSFDAAGALEIFQWAL